MNTSDLIQYVSEKSEIPKAESKDLYETLTDIIGEHFVNETGVLIPKFGSFQVKEKPSRRSFNPASGEYMQLPKKMTVTFTPVGQLKEDLK